MFNGPGDEVDRRRAGLNGMMPVIYDELRRLAISDRQGEPFTLADMATQLPSASPQLIKKVLAEMKNAGRVRLTGRGRGARWEVARG